MKINLVGNLEILFMIVKKQSLKSTPKMPLHVVTLNPMSSRWTRRILHGFPTRRQAYTLNMQNASGDISIGRDIDLLANTSELS